MDSDKVRWLKSPAAFVQEFCGTPLTEWQKTALERLAEHQFEHQFGRSPCMDALEDITAMKAAEPAKGKSE